jgi:hypothetical protein
MIGIGYSDDRKRRLVRMEVREVLVRALKEVDEADIPSELRAVAFGKAVDLLSTGAQDATRQLPPPRRDPLGNGQPAAESSPLERIATRLKLDTEVVQDVFDHDDDGLRVVVSPKKLEKQDARATKQLALLVAAGRQAAGLDEDDWTNVSEIRQVAEDYRKLDPSNFAKHIAQLQDEFSVRGSGQKRALRVTRPGWDAARELVERLAGAEG